MRTYKKGTESGLEEGNSLGILPCVTDGKFTGLSDLERGLISAFDL